MIQRLILVVACGLAGLLNSAERPNVVLIFTDDQGMLSLIHI